MPDHCRTDVQGVGLEATATLPGLTFQLPSAQKPDHVSSVIGAISVSPSNLPPLRILHSLPCRCMGAAMKVGSCVPIDKDTIVGQPLCQVLILPCSDMRLK